MTAAELCALLHSAAFSLTMMVSASPSAYASAVSKKLMPAAYLVALQTALDTHVASVWQKIARAHKYTRRSTDALHCGAWGVEYCRAWRARYLLKLRSNLGGEAGRALRQWAVGSGQWAVGSGQWAYVRS